MQGSHHQTVRLGSGRHHAPDHGVCVMELASMLAGEPFTDRPASVSPSLAAVLRGLNDGLDDERRQTLKRFAAASVGTTAGSEVEELRRWLIRTELLDPALRWGPGSRMCLRLGLTPAYSFGRMVGHRVATTDDDALFERTLKVVDELVAMHPGGGATVDADLVLAEILRAQNAARPAYRPHGQEPVS